MNEIPPSIQDLARRVIALEAASEPIDGPVGGATLACEKLRGPLARLVGVAGFRSLLSRALSLAKADAPSLEAVQVQSDGSLDGLDGIGQTQDAVGGTAVVTQLLGLLVTFIGETLTFRLVRDTWPDAPADGTDRGGEGQS